MKMNYRHILCAAILFFTCAFSVFAAAANPALGNWNCQSTDQNGNEIQWTLELREESGKLAGQITLASGDAVPVIDPKVEGTALKFGIKINDEETVAIEMRVDGDRVSGTFVGKMSGKGTIKGVRKT